MGGIDGERGGERMIKLDILETVSSVENISLSIKEILEEVPRVSGLHPDLLSNILEVISQEKVISAIVIYALMEKPPIGVVYEELSKHVQRDILEKRYVKSSIGMIVNYLLYKLGFEKVKEGRHIGQSAKQNIIVTGSIYELKNPEKLSVTISLNPGKERLNENN